MSEFPYYKQTVIGTCGPACLLMHFKHKNPTKKFGKFHEFKAWIEAWLIPFGMTESYSLAKHALKHGFKPIVIKEHQGWNMSFPKSWKLGSLFKLMLSYMKFTYNRARKSALKMGVGEKNFAVTPDLVKRIIDEGRKPIVMVDQSKYAWDASFSDGVLHWVVVTGYDKEGFYINDPDIKPNMKITNKEFEDAINLSNFGTDRRLVILD